MYVHTYTIHTTVEPVLKTLLNKGHTYVRMYAHGEMPSYKNTSEVLKWTFTYVRMYSRANIFVQ